VSDAPLRIAARASELATRQTRMVASLLEMNGIQSEIITVRTKGDRKREKIYEQGPPPGLFTHELEVALARNRVDCAVHTLKDLPVQLRRGLAIGAALEREDPREVLVVNPVTGADDFDSLPAGSRVGCSSLRRRAQLLAHRRDLEPAELRGSVPDRLRKVETGRVHAAILSAESLIRLGATRRITQYLEAPDWLPAAGQGTTVIEIRADDDRTRSIVEKLDHHPTAVATRAERAFLAELDGVPQMAVAALATATDDGEMTLHAFVSHGTGRDAVRGSIEVDQGDPEGSGRALAREMKTRGVSSLLLELRNADKFPE
jgi:hydroxymethylbilane synthase